MTDPGPDRPAADPSVAAPRTSRRTWLWVLAGVLALALSAAAGALVALRVAPRSAGSCDAAEVARNGLPAVVTVFATAPSGAGSGSGAVIEADGVIITNDHVIAKAATAGTIEVLFNDGQRLSATLVGTDPITDLAVLRVQRTGLPTLPLDASTQVTVGQPVVALGAPLGLSGTVTAGIVSAVNRDVPAPKAGGGVTILAGSIQTDAAINPGNSGGPLVNCDARLVGINTAGATVPNAEGVSGGGSVGLNFAVPVATAKRISDQLLAQGRASHPGIGAQVAEIPPAVASRFGTTTGLFVQQVTAGGPADVAGLRAGDVITAIRGAPASGVTLALLLVNAQVGDPVEVTYVRNGTNHSATITLSEQS